MYTRATTNTMCTNVHTHTGWSKSVQKLAVKFHKVVQRSI